MMWIFFAILSMLAFALTDLMSKRMLNAQDGVTPVEMLVSVLVPAFGISLVLSALGVGESGKLPWQLLFDYPLIFASQFCFLASWMFSLACLRYIGLAVAAAFSGTDGIFYFMGLLIINTVCGKLNSIREILQPARLIPVLFVLIFGFLLPNVEMLTCHGSEELRCKIRQERHRTIIGLLLLLGGLLCDAGDTLVTTWFLDGSEIGLMDFVLTSYFVSIVPIILLSLLLREKNGKWFIPFKDGGKYAITYPCMAVSASLLYLYAASLDAVRTGIVFIAQPVFPLIGAGVLLGEKYTWRQNLCIWMITASVIAFCCADYILDNVPIF